MVLGTSAQGTRHGRINLAMLLYQRLQSELRFLGEVVAPRPRPLFTLSPLYSLYPLTLVLILIITLTLILPSPLSSPLSLDIHPILTYDIIINFTLTFIFYLRAARLVHFGNFRHILSCIAIKGLSLYTAPS